MASKRTIPALWQKAVSEQRDFPAYLVETAEGWKPVSWEEAARRVEEIAFGLLDLGIKKGDAFGILSSTRLEWVLVDLALARIGAVTAPIYMNSSPADCAYMLGLVQAVGVFVEEGIGLAPRLQHVISFDELDALEARGCAYREQHPDSLARAEAAVDEEDLFTFIYTSGTTGPPKACMIRHRNYYAMAATVDLVDEFTMRADLLLLYLPLAHNFGRLLHLLGAYEGYTVALLSDPYRTADALPEVKPTVLPSVPRRGEALPAWLGFRHRIADRLVYSKVKERLGGKLRLAISGGAPLAKEIGEFFHALDILILEGYGLSECTTACSVNQPGKVKFGTVGPVLPGFEVRIAEDGEILIRSDTVFAGYYADDEATREAVDAEGWLHSGDIGELDEEGFLSVTDRKKDIIVTAGGKNVAPQNLENALKSARPVSQALVVGDRRPYLVALITLDEEEAAKNNPAEIEREIAELVEEVNRDRSRFEQIKKFTILPRDFSAEADEVTPTMKVKRRVCEEHFAAEIDGLYESS